MAFAPYDILDRLAGLTARPVRARDIEFYPSEAAVRGRFVDARDEGVALMWADLDAVLRFSAASAMLPLDAALHSLTNDAYLFDDFAELIAGCASTFASEDIRLAELSENVAVPTSVSRTFALEIWVPGYGSGRIGFGSLTRERGFRRTPSVVTVRRPGTLPLAASC